MITRTCRFSADVASTGRRRLIGIHPAQRETSASRKGPTNVGNFIQQIDGQTHRDHRRGVCGDGNCPEPGKIYRRDPSVEITLIDSENFFTFTPLLAEVPSGSIQPNHIVVPLRALFKRTKVKQAEVKSVDLKNRTVIAAHCGACGNECFH